ncbi:AAA family ATPase [Streptomyces sp. NPDC088400]|uniref:helix-turn-helix transcriptional regulator n=1 Tax=Streptomyces sp. NPDC088400 TaxID=3365861 RepID=UPI00380A4A58
MSVAPPVAADELVGRASVLAALGDMIETLERGGPGLAGVTGPLGIGRSAVLNRVATLARARGLAAGLARCSPVESDIPYAAVTQLLAGLRPPTRMLELTTACMRDGRIAASVPRLCDEFLALAAERPLLLAVDDLQWADPWSLRWFTAMTRRTHHSSILLVGSSHGPLAGHLGEDHLLDNAGFPTARELPLTPLSAAESRQLLENLSGRETEESVAVAATDATAGRPAVLRAVADHFIARNLPLDAAGIPRLTSVAEAAWPERAERAVRGLPADALALLRVLAAVGDDFEFEISAALAGLRAAGADSALGTLLAAGLAVDPDTPRPASPRLAADVLAAMDSTEREALYLRAAELGRKAGAKAVAVADLLAAAPVSGLPWAGKALGEASAYRLRQGRTSSAATDLRRALREPMNDADRARVLTRLAAIEVVNAPQASDGRLRQVLVRYASPDSWPSVLRAADLLLGRGDAETARRVLSELYQASAGSVDAAGLSPLSALGWLAQEEVGTRPEIPVAPLPAPAARPADPAQAGVLAWQLATLAEDRERVRELATAALDAHTDVPLMCRIAASRALLCAVDVEPGLRGLDTVVADARRQHARAITARALLHRGGAAIRRNRPEDGLRDLATALRELPLDSWHPSLAAKFVAMDIMGKIRCGQLEQARQAADRPLPDVADQGIGWAYLLYARAELRLVTGDPERALVYLEECGRLLRVRRWKNPMLLPWRTTAAVAHRTLGATDRAARLVAEEHAVLERWGTGDAVERMCGRTMDKLAELGVDLALNTHRRPEKPESSALDALPEPERDVARLALHGRLNREIAGRLDIATRTVELRLSKVYRKLGIKGRAELVARFAPDDREA